MNIQSIQIQGMHKVKNATYTFNDMAYLFGHNGAGKSTVMQAIQLAILGYIPGTDKNKTAIFRHANGPLMSVSLTFDNGYNITRSWAASGNNIVATISTTPKDLDLGPLLAGESLPIFNFNEFINMTANKLKDWFITFLPDADYGIDWKYELYKVLPLSGTENADGISSISTTPDNLCAAALDMIDNFDGSILDKVRKFNEYCKSEISATKTEITRLDSTVKSLIFYDDVDTSLNEDMLVAEIQAKDIQLQNTRHKQSIYYSNTSSINKRNELLAKYSVTSLEELEAIRANKLNERTEYVAKMAEYKAEAEGLIPRRDELSAIIKAASVTDSTCPYTMQVCATVQASQEQAKQKAVAVQDEYKQICCKISENSAAYDSYNTKLRYIDAQLNDINTVISAIDVLSEATVSENIDELNTIEQELVGALDQLRTSLEKTKANKQYESLKNKITADLFAAQEKLEVFKAWDNLTGVNNLQTYIMQAPFKSFSTQITKYLRRFFADNAISAEFYVGEKANSFSFGIKRNDVYIEYDLLSSGEKCLYTISLLLAITAQSLADLKLIMVDDLLDHLDDEKIQNCFATLYNTKSVQTILAGVQKCEHPEKDKIIIHIK